MVLVKQIEESSLLKQNSGSDQSKCPQEPLKGHLTGIKIPIYWLGRHTTNCGGACGVFACTAGEEQSLLDTLLLAQWEDRAWKGLLRYDVTACETKIIVGRTKFVAQLNARWNSNYFTEHKESESRWPMDCCKFMKMQMEELLFCVVSGEKATSELVALADVPGDANLIIINTNPVEYGHIMLVPQGLPQMLDVKSLEMATQITAEINNSFFRVFYDNPAASTVNYHYFEACYFANLLPVELAPAIPILSGWLESGIQICEIADYPLKTLLFNGNRNSKALIEIVAKICSCLQNQNSPFNLLISNHGTQIFLFPLVQTLATGGSNPSAWECGGHFVFNTKHDFDSATEEAMLARLAVMSLKDESFEAVKQLCCNIAGRYFS